MRRISCEGLSAAPTVKHGPTDLLESFAACLMRLTLDHRGDHGQNLVRLFAERVADEVLRYENKTDVSVDQLRAMHRMADAVVERAINAGRVLAYLPAEA